MNGPARALGHTGLEEDQVLRFGREGVLRIEALFTAAEVAVLERALPEIAAPGRAEVVLDEGGMVRMSHGAHLYNETFSRLSRHPRLVEPARALLDGEVYVYQTRLNVKPALDERAARGYPWHQDFSTWHFRDGLPEPRILTSFVLLDEITACNAPLITIPGSHRRGVIRDGGGHIEDGRYEQARISPRTLLAMAETGVTAQTGPAGTVVFMHGCIAHASSANVSPLRRAMFSIVYCAVGNEPRKETTPERYVARSFEAVRTLSDDCLARPNRPFR
jgi:ectoine hydroxylase